MAQGYARTLRGGASLAALTLALSGAAHASALPGHGHYVSGQGSINKANRSVTVKQSSTTGIIDWNKFSVGKKSSVTFDNGTGATLNRVTGGNLSTIAGSLHASGTLYLMNGSGVIISGSGRVVTGGSFVASSGSIGNDAFENDKLRIKNGHADVVNHGSIVAGHGVRLVGDDVTNTGSISASRVKFWTRHQLAVGGTITSRKVSGQGGTVIADGHTIDVSGRIDASADAAHRSGGTVVIDARGATTVSGQLVAKGGKRGTGGLVETSGKHVHIADSTHISTLADHGKTGTWVIDPKDFVIAASGGDIAGATLSSELATTDVLIQSIAGGSGTNGDVIVDDAVSWSSGQTLTLDAFRNIDVSAKVSITGAGNLVLIDADQTQTSDTAGANDGNAADGDLLFNGGRIAFTNVASGNDTQLTINGNAYTLENTVSDLQSAIGSNSSGDYALANNYDASSDGTYTSSPIGFFEGTFEGLGNTVSNITISAPVGSAIGFFNLIAGSGTVRDFGLVNANVTSSANASSVGVLAGENDGTVENVYATGSVADTTSYVTLGGLVALNNAGTIKSSHAAVSVTGGPEASAGGLVGENYGAGQILQSYATGAVQGAAGSDDGGLVGNDNSDANASNLIQDSYATGQVTASDESAVMGGLVGLNSGKIESSYATGDVSNPDNRFGDLGGLVGENAGGIIEAAYATGSVSGGTSADVGGLVGYNSTTSSKIDESYETGAATGGSGSTVGGLIGQNNNTSVGSSYYDYYNSTANSAAFGNTSSGNVSGIALSAMNNSANFSGWNFGTSPTGGDWVIVDADGSLNNASSATGGTLPMLIGEYSTTITNAHQLQLMVLDLTADYTLANDIDASGTAGGDVWGSRGFIAIAGNYGGSEFAGTLNGAGHSVDGLTIDDTTDFAVGLFGETAAGSTIENLALTNVDISGYSAVGGFVGLAYGGSILNSSVSGTATDTSSTNSYQGRLGGLIGINDGATISDSHADVAVDGGVEGYFVGGLVGINYGTISGSYATGTVTGQGDVDIGGLVGENYSGGTITLSYATAAVQGTNSTSAGGLVGLNESTISQSYATGAVTVGESGYSGGLAGDNAGTITQSFATGAVSAGNFGYEGGMVGANNGAISQSYATGNVQTADGTVGGFVGLNATGGTIDQSYSLGTVTGSTNGFAGGDQTAGGITKSYWDKDTSGTTQDGASSGTIGMTTTELQSALASGFDGSVWSIVAGTSFPYLTWQFPDGAPQVVSGHVLSSYGGSGVSGVAVTALNNGVALSSALGTVASYADGYYYYLLAPNTLGSGSNVIAYRAGTNGAALADNISGSVSNLDVYGGYLHEVTSDSDYSDIAPNLATAIGSNSAAQSAVNGASNLAIDASESFDIDSAIDLGGGTLVINTSGGNPVTQDAAITAGELLLEGDSAFTLTNASNSIGTLAAYGTGALSLDDNSNLTIGSVAGIAGITAGGDVSLATATGNIAITQEIDTNGNALALASAGTIAESGSGVIDAASLTGSSHGAVALNGANVITDLGSFSTGGKSFSLKDDHDLTTTGTVNTGSGALTLTTTGSGHDIAIHSKLESTGTVKLASAATISENSAGDIDAKTLTGSSKGAVTLTSSKNVITDLGAFTTGGNNAFSLTDDHDLTTTGTVNAGSHTVTLATTGSGHDIAVDSKLQGGEVKLASAATISESNAGDIDAKTLTGSAHGAVKLTSAKNTVTDLGAFSAAAFAFTDDHALTVDGKINAGTGTLDLTTVGENHNLAIDAAIIGGTINLVTTGEATESSSKGAITAKLLNVTADTGIELTSKHNKIKKLGTHKTKKGPNKVTL